MKLDIMYIRQIIRAVEENKHSSMSQEDLMKVIKCDRQDETSLERFYYHMKRIEERGLLISSDEDFGFSFYKGGMSLSNPKYVLTWSGSDFLNE